MNSKLLCLHGFAGSGDDFGFLADDFDIIAPNLDELVSLEFNGLKHRILVDYCKDQEVNVLGYSFGGRLAARLKIAAPSQIKQTIICSSHMGHKKVPQARIELERSIVSKLENMNKEEFFAFWNELDLFRYDDKSNASNASLDILKMYFTNYGQSIQPYLLDDLMKLKNEITFVFGQKDKKYCEYANENLTGFNLEFISSGHRVLQNQEAILKLLKVII